LFIRTSLEAGGVEAPAILEEAIVGEPEVHGVAYFCEEGGELRAYALRRRPRFDVAATFRHGPALEPLIEAMPGPVWAVAVVSRKHGRVIRGTDTGLVEVGDVNDDVHRRHSQGGWSQARYQRGIEKETGDHVRRVCDLLFALHERRPFDHLAIVGPPEMLPVVESSIPTCGGGWRGTSRPTSSTPPPRRCWSGSAA
jgi:peptide chain release factor subunit 1